MEDNLYKAPDANVEVAFDNQENNSGLGLDDFPEGVKGWSWGAFFFNWLWAIFNKTWIGLLAFLPYIGIIVAIVLGVKGRQWAWKNKRWDSIEHFNKVQRRWSVWGFILVFGVFGLGILAAIAIPAYQDYVTRAAGG